MRMEARDRDTATAWQGRRYSERIEGPGAIPQQRPTPGARGLPLIGYARDLIAHRGSPAAPGMGANA